MRRVVTVVGTMAVLMSGACHRAITVASVNQVIHVCKTRVQTVRKEFGRPDKIGEMGGMVTNEYDHGGTMGESPVAMMVAYVNDVVVDVAVNPAGLVEMQNRCVKTAASSSPPPSPAPPSSARTSSASPSPGAQP